MLRTDCMLAGSAPIASAGCTEKSDTCKMAIGLVAGLE
jgi:hypothetical protein